MRLVLVRHAEAAPGSPDELRTLTAKGVEQARQLGERLRSAGIEADVVLTSPLLRARETGAALGFGAPEAHEALAPGATDEDVREAIAGRGDIVIVVGHQPDCGRIAAALGEGVEPEFPPAGAVVLDLPS
jgi:phosphohistidine phosphatase